MDSGPTLKPKVTVKLNYDRTSNSPRPPSRDKMPLRPISPVKPYVSMTSTETTFRPKAKVNSSATTRKTTGTAGSTVSVSNSATSTPRAGSPTKMTPRVKNGVVSSTNKVGGTLRSTPLVASAPVTPELRRTMQAQSSYTSLRTDDARSQISNGPLHHAASFSNFRPSSSSVVSSSGSVSHTSSPRLLSAKSTMNLGERSQTSSPTPRIRSKISTVAKVATDPTSPQLPSPSTSSVSPSSATPSSATLSSISASSRPITSPRSRKPSITSSMNQIFNQPSPPPSSPPQFYPITTAVSAANPHRFATNRPPNPQRTNGSPGHHVFQSFSHQPSSSQLDSSLASTSKRPRSASGLLNGSPAIAKVDPVSIPLPPHSPPTSVVSFSSRSSASRSSANGLGGDSHSSNRGSPTLHRQNGSDNLRATLDNLIQYTTSGTNSATEDDDGDSGLDRGTDGEVDGRGEEHKVKAAAKSNRKIADLEITNRSLLVINASLEATKHKQAKEIRELRRKLRESRLILPPRAYKAVTSNDPAEVVEDDEDELDGASDSEETEGDETYKRIKMILENLLVTGKAALEIRKEDFSGSTSFAKVLSPQEQRDYHGTIEADQYQHDGEHIATEEDDTLLVTEMDLTHQRHKRESVDIPQGSGDNPDKDKDYYDFNDLNDNDVSFGDVGNETMTSEDEVEAMTISGLSPPSSPHPPPILITKPM